MNTNHKKKIILAGNPNVGKSAIFSRITGLHVTVSNYPGTTVEYLIGSTFVSGEEMEIIDLPGTYSLLPLSKAEAVAVEMIDKGDIVINVVDATNLERNLNLTLELLELNKPMIVLLNMWDETRHKGISIDVPALQNMLGVPVIPTIATTGEGVKEAMSIIESLKEPNIRWQKMSEEERWSKIGNIVSAVQRISHHHHTLLERLEDLMIHPVGGLLFAAVVVAASFLFTRAIGEGLINYIFDPFFEKVVGPLLTRLSLALSDHHFLHELLIGRLVDGKIHFKESMGILSTGLYLYPAAVFPYIIAFYLVLGLMEDIGYLPRIAVLIDNLMHRIGLHGYAVIPNILGFGCNVPGIMATRILESTRERFITATLISIAVPCAALQAMIIGMVGRWGIRYVFLVFGILFLIWVIIGILLNWLVKGYTPPLLLEVPPIRFPSPRIFFKKYWMRLSYFAKEAFPIMLTGIIVATFLSATGFIEHVANITSPLVHTTWGLPKEAIVPIAIGFIRKDIAVGMLEPLHLTLPQTITATVVLSIFFPCVASFVVLFKELKWKLMLASTGIMLLTSMIVGGITNLVGKMF